MAKWQHTIPQRNLNHEPAPRPQESVITGNKGAGTCAVCRKSIYLVGDNEGPESLKSLLIIR